MLNQKKITAKDGGRVTRLDTMIGPSIKVIKDPKSKTRVFNFPFDFADGEKGVVIVCRIEDAEWKPYQDIKSISIEFTEDTSKI